MGKRLAYDRGENVDGSWNFKEVLQREGGCVVWPWRWLGFSERAKQPVKRYIDHFTLNVHQNAYVNHKPREVASRKQGNKGATRCGLSMSDTATCTRPYTGTNARSGSRNRLARTVAKKTD